MTKLYKFQRTGVRLLKERFNLRAILGDEQGLGKTVQVLFAIKNHLPPSPVVIVCPAHLKENWRREAAKHTRLKASVLSSRTPPKRLPVGRARLYIINYDILQYWVEWLRELVPSMVVADEFQNIKNWDALRTQAFVNLCKDIEHIIGTSGTPIVNHHADLFPMLHVLFPKRFKELFAFAFKYCQPQFIRGRWQYRGAKNAKKLRKILYKKCLIRRLIKDVFKDLPEKIISVVPLVLTKAQMKEYNEAERNIVKWLEKTQPHRAKKARRNERLAKFHYLDRLIGQLKQQAVDQWIKSFHEEGDDKLVAFGWHTDVIQHFHEKFKDSVMITGKTSIHKRQLRTDKFNRDKVTRNLFGNLQAAGTGWSCTSSSSVAFFQYGWTPADHNQAMSRVHGLGRGRKGRVARIYFLIVPNTIEEDKCTILQKKQDISDRLLDGKKRKTVLNRSIYDLVEDRLLKRRKGD